MDLDPLTELLLWGEGSELELAIREGGRHVGLERLLYFLQIAYFSQRIRDRFDWEAIERDLARLMRLLAKDQQNQKKHGVSFAKAQFAFADPSRVIAEDLSHSSREKRYYCFGWVEDAVLTVRFTYREDVIRILGAGYWRRGKGTYERENQIHRRTTRKPTDRS